MAAAAPGSATTCAQGILSGDRVAGATAENQAKLNEAQEKVAKITLGGDGQPTGTTPVEGL